MVSLPARSAPHVWRAIPGPRTCPLETVCAACGQAGALRPDVVWFGEMPREMDRIYQALVACDLFVSIGTSGSVYPAAGFVAEARAAGAHTVELNLEPSEGASLFAEAALRPGDGDRARLRRQTAPRLALEMRDHLDMRREQELIDRRDAGDAVAAIDQDAEVAGERAGIAGDGDDLRHVRLGERLGLRRGAGPRRIEHHRVVGFQLLDAERRAEQVADDGRAPA